MTGARKVAPADPESAAVIDRLRRALGPAAVRLDRDSIEYFAADALSGQRGWLDDSPAVSPVAVVEPATTGELSALMRICHDGRIAVTPYGAGSGLMGGARSLRP